MPKVKKDCKYEKKFSEQDVAKALEAIEGGMSERRAAETYNVNRSTLQFRRSTKFKNKTTFGPSPVLTDQEEEQLEQFILNCHKKGFPTRDEDIKWSVKKFLDQNPRNNPFKDNLPGKGWMLAFLRRHPNITLRTAEGITSASSLVSEANIKKWFASIKTYLEEKGLDDILTDPSRIFNGDETCFLLCPKNKKVLAPKGTRNVYEIEHNPKKNITVMFTFSAEGKVTPPMIIYAQSRISEKIRQSVPSNWGLGCSENGWMKNELFYEYIGNVFYPFVRDQGIQFPIILFVDGHSTHMTFQLSELCRSLNIVLVALYPNATRIMQPADVAAFKPLKNAWKSSVLEFRRNNPDTIVNKENFGTILQTAIEKGLKPESIINGFRTCGLYPWNASALDFTKCTGKNKTMLEDPTKTESKEKYLTESKFKEIIGENYAVFTTFQEEKDKSPNKEFLMLYQIFCEFKKDNVSKNDDLTDRDENSNEISIVEVPELLNSDDEKNINPTCVEERNEKYIPVFDTDSVPMIAEDVTNISSVIQDNASASTSAQPLFNNAKGELMVTFIDQATSVPVNQNVKIGSYFTWPSTPERKGKKVNKLPFVLTSSARKKIDLEKQEKKQKEELLKEKKKAERIAKKAEKEGKPKRKQKEKVANQKKNTIRSSTIKTKPILTKPINEIENNTKVTSQICKIDAAKRNLFLQDENLMDSRQVAKQKKEPLNIISNIVLKPATITKESDIIFIKNKKVAAGLCFSCTYNMSESKMGIKCPTCERSYHIECAKKLQAESDSFTCLACLGKKQ